MLFDEKVQQPSSYNKVPRLMLKTAEQPKLFSNARSEHEVTCTQRALNHTARKTTALKSRGPCGSSTRADYFWIASKLATASMETKEF